jgi:hypothetical protein
MTEVIPYEEPDDDALANQQYDEEAVKGRRATTTVGQAAALMLVSGSDFEEIAEILELPNATVARRITEKALAQKFDAHDKKAAKRLVLARYEALYASALRRANNPKYSSREAAAGNALKAVGEIVRVMGLAEPSELIVRTPTETEIMQELAKIGALAAADLPEETDVIEGHVVRDEPA